MSLLGTATATVNAVYNHLMSLQYWGYWVYPITGRTVPLKSNDGQESRRLNWMQLNERTTAQIADECKLRLYPKSNGVHFNLAASM